MKYDFESITPRHNLGSAKWNEMLKYNVSTEEDIIPFSVADMEFNTAPEIKEGLKKFIDTYVLGYANQWESFQNAVCKWMKERHNWEIKPEWIVSTNGIIEAFYTAVHAYTEEGDGVILMTPIYYPMYKAIQNNGRVLLENPLIRTEDSYQIDFEDLEEKAKRPDCKMLIFCSPHNPSGRVWTTEELERVAEICIRNNVIIASDEIHFDLVSPGYKHHVFASLSEEISEHCLIMTAPSKTFNLAGLQTSNIIIPNKNLRDIFMEEMYHHAMNPKCNILGYEACRIAYEQCAEWVDEVNQVIDTNRRLVIDFLNREFPQIQVYKLEGTYLLWMDFSALGIHHLELEKILKGEAHVFFDEGYIFGAAGEGFERWNLACPTRYVEEALERLKNVLTKYVK